MSQTLDYNRRGPDRYNPAVTTAASNELGVSDARIR